MTKWFILSLLASVGSLCQGQVTGNVLARTFQIRVPEGTGSAFIIDYRDRQYIVTANHMVASMGERGTVEFFANQQWVALPFKILHGASKCDDVAVLIPDEKQILKVDAIPVADSYIFGQEAFFAGFPYGLYTTFSNSKQIVPLLKHGYVSARVSCSAIYPNEPEGAGVILLDGMNNHGFSGGPVVIVDPSDANHRNKLIGVISGFQGENVSVSVNGVEQKQATVMENSGIVVVVPIQRATALIEDSLSHAK
jgi:S1-C subfamily serine protease